MCFGAVSRSAHALCRHLSPQSTLKPLMLRVIIAAPHELSGDSSMQALIRTFELRQFGWQHRGIGGTPCRATYTSCSSNSWWFRKRRSPLFPERQGFAPGRRDHRARLRKDQGQCEAQIRARPDALGPSRHRRKSPALRAGGPRPIMQLYIGGRIPVFRTKPIRVGGIGSAARKKSPAEAGQGLSWKENQDEAPATNMQISAVLRL